MGLAGHLQLNIDALYLHVSFPSSLIAWAAGAIAYELFGGVSPFSWDRLDSRTYQDEQLPPLAM